jgi:hypothetical protein
MRESHFDDLCGLQQIAISWGRYIALHDTNKKSHLHKICRRFQRPEPTSLFNHHTCRTLNSTLHMFQRDTTQIANRVC